MLPEVGGLEWLIIAIVALIVVGPKDLPVMMRRLGEFLAKLRNMASEFRASFDEMARQSELDDLRKEVEAMRRGQFLDMSTQTEHIEANSTIRDIEQSMAEVGVSLHTPPYQYEPAVAPPPLEISEAPATRPARKPRATKAPAAKSAAKPRTAKPKVTAAAEPAAKPPVARKPRAKKSAGAGS
jgi:sec-independent protein translocase protein TatB